MKKDNMITIQIEAGCPSGSSNFWNRTRTVAVHKELVSDFIGNLMEYARREAIAPHWRYSWHYDEEE